MRLEHLPILFGILVGLVGAGLIGDAWLSDGVAVLRERRRRVRAEPHKGGEASVGVGVLCMAAALIGRDAWRFGTVAVILGAVLVVVGAVLNRKYLAELLTFRGAARRSDVGTTPPDASDPTATERLRIR
jgi:hypothetical protein